MRKIAAILIMARNTRNKSSETLRFAISGDEGEFIFPPSYVELIDKFDGLLDQVDEERMSETRFRQKLRELVKQHPWFLVGHEQLARELNENGQVEQALNSALRGLGIARKAVPRGFDGLIPWNRLDNRAFLSLLEYAGHCYTLLEEHAEAAAVMAEMLKWNPNDNQGMRWCIGSALLRSGKTIEAREKFESHASEYPPLHYELGLLLLREQNYVQAATSLRRGFATNFYIAELLSGIQLSPPRPLAIWHSSNLEAPEIALEYLTDYALLWPESSFALDFVRWLFHHPKVLMERARLLEIREELLWEEPGDKRSRLVDQQYQALDRIDDTLSETLIEKRTDRYGNTGYPWEYPFDRPEEPSLP